MKNFAFIALLFLVAFAAQGQNKLRAYLDTKQYYAPTIGNYLEVQFEFVGHTVQYTGVKNGLQGEVAIQIIILKGKEVVKSDGYRLTTPLMKDSIVENFFDIKRFALEPGEYNIDIKLLDMSTQDPGISANVPIKIADRSTDVGFSTVQVIEYASEGNPNSPFYKSGYEIIPRISNYFPNDLSFLPYYVEIYNSKDLADSVFGVRQRIIDTENNEAVEDYTQFFKYNAQDVVPVIRKIDIGNLITGRYKLEIGLVNKKMELVSKTDYTFERTNDKEIQLDEQNLILDPNFIASIHPDSIQFYLGSLIPIAKAESQRTIMKTLASRDKDMALKNIQAFWVATAGSQAYSEWMKYKQSVLQVQKMYKTNFQDGYETDRGRVYLQYGAPTNIVQREASASEYPYEIWQYNKIERFSNKRFIFYNPDLLNNSYRLLHSDMIGELKNNNWPLALNQRNTSNGNIDNPNGDVQEHYGGSSNTLFRQY